jgi:hypothetical protein
MREREKSVKASGLIAGFRFRLFLSPDSDARASLPNDIQNAQVDMPFVGFCSPWDKAKHLPTCTITSCLLRCGKAVQQPCSRADTRLAASNLEDLVW